MAKPKLARTRDFVQKALKAPLFQFIGKKTDDLDLDVVYAKSLEEAMSAFQGRMWNDALTRSGNHARAQIAVALGEKLPLRYEYSGRREHEAIQKAVKPLHALVDKMWSAHKLPLTIGRGGFLKPREYVKGFFFRIAEAYVYEDVVANSFGQHYLEPALMAGHLPCGWKGRLPAEGIKRSDVGRAVTEKVAAKTLKEYFGDGKLIVY
jgi:hypothetical protein